MDESFQLRARRLLDGSRDAAPLAHDVLRVTLATQQAATPTACVQARSAGKATQPCQSDLLTELLLAGSGWVEAASNQNGCFNRAESARRRNGS